MDTAMVVDLGRQALWMTMLISGPLLIVGLVIGLLVGVFQAATSINETAFSKTIIGNLPYQIDRFS